MPGFYRRSVKRKYTNPLGPFVIYLPDGGEYSRQEEWKEEKYYHLLSIDPGRTNFAIRLEKRYDGKVETIKMENIDIRDNKQEGINVEYNNINKVLKGYSSYFDDLHIVVIEHQINLNPDTPRVLQHVISYFLLNLQNKKKKPLILEVDPALKGKQLGYIKSEHGTTKTWAKLKALELLQERKDEAGLKIMKSKGKKDDMADTICQAEAVAQVLKLCTKKKIIFMVKRKINFIVKKT
jgi:hypothetical protein